MTISRLSGIQSSLQTLIKSLEKVQQIYDWGETTAQLITKIKQNITSSIITSNTTLLKTYNVFLPFNFNVQQTPSKFKNKYF